MTVAPGELGAFDPRYVERHAGWLKRMLFWYFRARVEGMHHLPTGPFVGVGNHSGATLMPDTLVWIAAYHTSGREPPLLALAHDGLFSQYPAALASALSRLGAVRADRALALEALRRGYAVQVYPGGDYDACRSFRRRNEIVFAGRTGYVELARQAGVPIVPVLSVGGHEALMVLWDGVSLARWLGLDRRLRLRAFPLSLSVPWGLWLGPLPGYVPLPARIDVRVLPPICADDGSVDEVDRRVRACLQRAADELVADRRFPWIG